MGGTRTRPHGKRSREVTNQHQSFVPVTAYCGRSLLTCRPFPQRAARLCTPASPRTPAGSPASRHHDGWAVRTTPSRLPGYRVVSRRGGPGPGPRLTPHNTFGASRHVWSVTSRHVTSRHLECHVMLRHSRHDVRGVTSTLQVMFGSVTLLHVTSCPSPRLRRCVVTSGVKRHVASRHVIWGVRYVTTAGTHLGSRLPGGHWEAGTVRSVTVLRDPVSGASLTGKRGVRRRPRLVPDVCLPSVPVSNVGLRVRHLPQTALLGRRGGGGAATC